MTTPVENLAVAVSERSSAPIGSLDASNTITFADRDLTDTHTVSPTGTPLSGGTLGTVTAVKTADTTGTGTGGSLTWSYSVAASAVEYLAAGQTKLESFELGIDDGNGSVAVRTVTATITGSNDPVVITAETLAGSLVEMATPVGVLSTSATLSFTDVDLADVHTVSAAGTPLSSGTLGSLAAVKLSDTTGSGSGGQIRWTYSVAAAAVEYLAAGQTRVESFTISLGDGKGSTIERQIDVTITGTNDAPRVTAEDLAGAVTEAGTPSGNLSDSGTIDFSDVDLTDAHTVTPAGTPVGTTLGSLAVVRTADTTGTGTGGEIRWTYSVAAADIEYLAAGQTRVEQFDLTLADGNGGSFTRRVAVTLTGSNDAVVVTAEQLTASITELLAPTGSLTASGNIEFSDVDLADVHTVSPNGTALGPVLGSLTAAKTADTTNVGTGGRLVWNYSVAASALEYLAAGQTKVDSFTLTLADGQGSSLTRRIDITLVGTNDAPLVVSARLAGGVTEAGTPAGNLTDSGTIAFSDVDLADVHTVTPAGTPVGTTLGSLAVAKTADTTGSGTGGALAWTYSVAAADVEYLAAGQTRLEQFDLTLSDGNGGSFTRRIAVTITGSNDAPLVTVEDLVGGVTEAGTPAGNLTDSGTISFTDVDLTDVHTVTPAGTPVGTTLGSLAVAKTADTTGSGTGGQLTWNYSVAASAVEYLAAGQTRLEQFDLTLSDGNGGSFTRRVAVTITGSNDAVVITAQDLVGAVTEAVAPTGNLTDSGTIAFSDVDLNDVHLVSPAGTAVGSVLGSLTAVKNTDTTGSGTGGQLTWNYAVAASAVEYLAAGQTKVESFTITLDDQKGSVTTRQIDVTITGTNDAPVIGVQDLVGAVTELVTPVGNLTDSGTIAFSDVDLNDVHLVSPTGTAVGSVLGSLTAVKNTDTTGSGTGGQLTWNYSVAASAVEYLAAGQTKVESFTITLNDQKGSVITRQIDVTITGTNDAPVIGVQDLVGAVTEAVTPVGNLSDSGTIAFSDVDLNDVHLVSPTGTAVGSVLGSLTAVKNTDTTGSGTGGQLTWNYIGRGLRGRVPRCRPDQGRELHDHARRPEGWPRHPADRRDDHRHQRRAGDRRAGPRRRGHRSGHAGRQPDRQRHHRLQRCRPERRAPGLADRHGGRQRARHR